MAKIEKHDAKAKAFAAKIGHDAKAGQFGSKIKNAKKVRKTILRPH